MSGPLAVDEPAEDGESPSTPGPVLEITPSRVAKVDGQTVRRALPIKGRRTVGAWCFADHIGPEAMDGGPGLGIGPHPHIGLQTVTWLLSGEVLHRDSLGSEQLIRPGQLNLMTAGHGVAHAEESPDDFSGELHGIQLWVAQPERTRHGEPAFEHHAELPHVEGDGFAATVLVGDFAGASSPARRDTDHVGVEITLDDRATLPLDPRFEHGLVVLEGAVTVEDTTVEPGNFAYLGGSGDELHLRAAGPARFMLLGGVPFEAPLLMWWNFVARTRDEVDAATAAWEADDGRFGHVDSGLPRIPAQPTPWPKA